MLPREGSNTTTRHARRSSCIPSCFASSPALDSDDDTKPSAPRLDGPLIRTPCSCLRRRKKMVLVVAPEELVSIAKSTSNEAEMEETKEIQLEEDRGISVTPKLTRGSKKGFLAKLLKGIHDKASQSHQNTKSNKAHVSKTEEPHHHQMSDDNNCRSTPTRPGQSPDGCQSGTRSSNPSSPVAGPFSVLTSKSPIAHAKPVGKLSWLFRWSVPVLTLAMIVFFGRAAAIVSLSSCFYYLRLLDPTNATKNGSHERIAMKETDWSAGEYKKKVVMQGQLARRGRKPWGFLA